MQQQPSVPTPFTRDTPAEEIAAAADLTGKLAVITGGSAGLGLETARSLAAAGADLFIAGRRRNVVEEAGKLLGQYGRDVRGFALDLMSPASVEALADAVLALGRPVDMFIANAGIMACPLKRTSDGIESQFMTNVVGHALLLSRLSEALKQSPDGRFISLSSTAHQLSPIRFEDIQFQSTPYDKWKAYGQSKTANVLIAVKAAKELGPNGVACLAVHPGMINTELSRSLDENDLKLFSQKRVSGPAVTDRFKDVPRGAATSVWAATEPLLKGKGPLYLEDSKVAEVIATPRHSDGVMPYALDATAADRLWGEIEKIVGQSLSL